TGPVAPPPPPPPRHTSPSTHTPCASTLPAPAPLPPRSALPPSASAPQSSPLRYTSSSSCLLLPNSATYDFHVHPCAENGEQVRRIFRNTMSRLTGAMTEDRRHHRR